MSNKHCTVVGSLNFLLWGCLTKHCTVIARWSFYSFNVCMFKGRRLHPSKHCTVSKTIATEIWVEIECVLIRIILQSPVLLFINLFKLLLMIIFQKLISFWTFTTFLVKNRIRIESFVYAKFMLVFVPLLVWFDAKRMNGNMIAIYTWKIFFKK